MDHRDGGGPFRTLRRIVFGGLIVGAFVLFVLWRTENPRLAQARLALMDAAAPAIEAVAGPSTALAELFDDVRSLSELQAENARLRERVTRLETWRDKARTLESENARLRAIAEVAPPPRASFVTAQVIADAGGPYGQSMIVNVGERDGVTEGAPALDPGGLVGRAAGVGDRASRVILLTDPASRVPVRVGGGGLRAILVGDETGRPRLDHLGDPSSVDGRGETRGAPVGARIETSGQGGVFPAGLLVGVVAAGADGEARAALAADLDDLTFLRLVRAAEDRERPPGPRIVLRGDDTRFADAEEPAFAAPPAPLRAEPTALEPHDGEPVQ